MSVRDPSAGAIPPFSRKGPDSILGSVSDLDYSWALRGGDSIRASHPLLLPVRFRAKHDPDRALLWLDSLVHGTGLGEGVLFIRLAPRTVAESFQHFILISDIVIILLRVGQAFTYTML